MWESNPNNPEQVREDGTPENDFLVAKGESGLLSRLFAHPFTN
jgi:hypothetical protein